MKAWWLDLRVHFWLWRYSHPVKRAICRMVGHDWRWIFYKGRRCNRCWVNQGNKGVTQ